MVKHKVFKFLMFHYITPINKLLTRLLLDMLYKTSVQKTFLRKKKSNNYDGFFKPLVSMKMIFKEVEEKNF